MRTGSGGTAAGGLRLSENVRAAGFMVLAGICGSWLGTRLRGVVPQRDFHKWFRVLVSALAVRMILMAL